MRPVELVQTMPPNSPVIVVIHKCEEHGEDDAFSRYIFKSDDAYQQLKKSLYDRFPDDEFIIGSFDGRAVLLPCGENCDETTCPVIRIGKLRMRESLYVRPREQHRTNRR
jgi:hypothetical protein